MPKRWSARLHESMLDFARETRAAIRGLSIQSSAMVRIRRTVPGLRISDRKLG
jgi:hypothetical protein